MEYPEIIQETCTGCGICVVIDSGKARIVIDKCQACRICVTVCEVQAIV